MKKTLLLLLVLVILVLGGALLARNMLLKSAAQQTIKKMTGLELRLRKIDVGLFKTTLEVEGLELVNPPDFPRGTALEVRRLFVDYDLPSLFSDEVHLHKLDLDIPAATVIKSEKGTLNIDGLKKLAAGEEKKPAASAPRKTPAPAPAEKPAPQPAKEVKARPEKTMRIDDLAIHLGTVTYIDYSRGPEPTVFKHNLNVDVRKENVTDPEQIVAAVSGQLLVGALGNLGGIAEEASRQLDDLVKQGDLNMEELQKTANEGLARLGRALDRASQDPDSPVSQLLGTLVGGQGDNGSDEAGEAVEQGSTETRDAGDEAGAETEESVQKAGAEAEKAVKDIKKEIGNALRMLGAGSESK